MLRLRVRVYVLKNVEDVLMVTVEGLDLGF